MLAALSVALCLSTACVLASNDTPISNLQGPLGWNLSEQAQGELRALIAGGNPSDLRWPDFVDFRDQVFTFYQAGAYSLAWFRDSKVTPQAVAMIELFKTAAQNGLSDENYDGPRWDARLEKMQTLASPQSPEALIRFDLALTVCAMRYISALRLGRVNPRHFKFGLDVGPKKYDLTDFLRNQVIFSPNVKTKIEQLEPTLPGYQRAKAALATYVKLAEQGDADSLPVPRKTIHPGDTYQGIPQLLSRLRQLGDLGSVSDRSEHATTYTDPVVDAVRRFQTRHGLEPDGLLDRAVTHIRIRRCLPHSVLRVRSCFSPPFREGPSRHYRMPDSVAAAIGARALGVHLLDYCLVTQSSSRNARRMSLLVITPTRCASSTTGSASIFLFK